MPTPRGLPGLVQIFRDVRRAHHLCPLVAACAAESPYRDVAELPAAGHYIGRDRTPALGAFLDEVRTDHTGFLAFCRRCSTRGLNTRAALPEARRSLVSSDSPDRSTTIVIASPYIASRSVGGCHADVRRPRAEHHLRHQRGRRMAVGLCYDVGDTFVRRNVRVRSRYSNGPSARQSK